MISSKTPLVALESASVKTPGNQESHKSCTRFDKPSAQEIHSYLYFWDCARSVLYSIEELLAILLNYGRDLAEAHTKEPIKDTVITVPPFFGQAERKGLLDAAEIAGLSVLL